MNDLERSFALANDVRDPKRAKVFQEFVMSLTEEETLDLPQLYELPYGDFDVAIGAIREWRLQRYIFDANDVGFATLKRSYSEANAALTGPIDLVQR